MAPREVGAGEAESYHGKIGLWFRDGLEQNDNPRARFANGNDLLDLMVILIWLCGA
jgi:hypothetical protein